MPDHIRIDLRLSPTQAGKLAKIARHRTTNNSKPDALRMLIDEGFAGLVRGETEAPAVERKS